MEKITQTMRFRQVVIEYSLKHGVTQAAICYKLNRQYVYRWCKRYNGALQSLADRSHRPHSHPNQHTNMRRRNPNTGIVVFWVKLRQHGYTRSISGLSLLFWCRFAAKISIIARGAYPPLSRSPHADLKHPASE